MMEELWKDVQGYEGKYKVSNTGKVWSNYKKDLMALQYDKDGYLWVGLRNNGDKKKVFVHTLVLEHFGIVKPFNDATVNHKDHNKTNNNIDNLEWLSRKENSLESVHYNKQTKKVRCIETGIVYPSRQAASNATGANVVSIGYCINGRQHTAGGYHWEVIEDE